MSDLKRGQELLSVWANGESGARVGYNGCIKITIGWINGHMANLETAICSFEKEPDQTFILSNCDEFTVKPKS